MQHLPVQLNFGFFKLAKKLNRFLLSERNFFKFRVLTFVKGGNKFAIITGRCNLVNF